MGQALDKVNISGFKSIKSLEDFQLRKLNVMIGGNGAGKSNFIDFFRLLRAMMELSLPDLEQSSLQTFIQTGGGADDFLFNGPKVTEQIEVELIFGENGYRFKLAPTVAENFIINEEKRYYPRSSSDGWLSRGSGHTKPELLKEKDDSGFFAEKGVAYYVYNAIKSWQIYHFHDTGKNAPMRRYEIVEDDALFRFDAANIAPFLLRLRAKENQTYSEIVETIRLVTPFFADFVLKPREFGSKQKVNLSWNQKGSDYPLQPYHFSDGTIRFICLATALLQPDPPSTIIIDEPELGLHPYAIEILAELMQSASKKTQVIVSTQSPALIDNFKPEDVIVVNRDQGASTFKRLDEKELSHWLEEYSLGDLWRKNIVAGGPVHE